MELIDYLHIARRRLWILILIPLLAVCAAAALALATPAKYTATATVSTTGLVTGSASQFTGTQAVNQFVAAFNATSTGPAVLAEAAKQTGVPAKQISAGLVVQQRGASSDMSLTFTSDRASNVIPVLTAVENNTLQSMFSPPVELTKKQLEITQGAVAAANNALTGLGDKYGITDPAIAYQAELDRLNGLEQRQASLNATGNTGAAQAMQLAIDNAKAKLATYGPVLSQYNNLIAQRQAAVSDLTAARQAYRLALAERDAADPKNITFITAVTSEGRARTLMHTVPPALAAGIFLAAGLVFMLELLSGSDRSAARSRSRDADSAGQPAGPGGEPAAGLAESSAAPAAAGVDDNRSQRTRPRWRPTAPRSSD